MKKIVSLVLAVVVLCTLLSVFVLPASAEEAPVEIGKNMLSRVTGNCIFSAKGETDADIFGVQSGACLTIAEGATVNVSSQYTNNGTIVLHGTLKIKSGATFVNRGVLIVYGTVEIDQTITADNTNGTIYIWGEFGAPLNKTVKIKNVEGTIKSSGCSKGIAGVTVISGNADEKLMHVYYKGSCVCGHGCPGSAHSGICPECFGETEEIPASASILSGGSLVIIVGVAAFVLGLGAAFVVMCVVRKRRNKDAS